MGYFHRWTDFPAHQNLRPGTMRRTVVLDGLTAQRGEMAPDSKFDERSTHRHPEDQIIVILEGKMRLKVGDEERWLGPGELAAVPGGVYHTATGVGPEGAVYIEVLSGGRIDYLPGYAGPSKNEFLHGRPS